MTTRTRKEELTAGKVIQIKIIKIDDPIRFEVESGTFNYEVLLNDQVIVASTAVSSGVVTAPGGAWGSEVRITCATAGTLHVAYTG